MTNIFLQGLTADEFSRLIETSIFSVLKENIFDSIKSEKDILTREEASEYLSIDLSTLHAWVNKGKLKCYSLGSRRYFKKSDIVAAMIQLKPS